MTKRKLHPTYGRSHDNFGLANYLNHSAGGSHDPSGLMRIQKYSTWVDVAEMFAEAEKLGYLTVRQIRLVEDKMRFRTNLAYTIVVLKNAMRKGKEREKRRAIRAAMKRNRTRKGGS